MAKSAVKSGTYGYRGSLGQDSAPLSSTSLNSEMTLVSMPPITPAVSNLTHHLPFHNPGARAEHGMVCKSNTSWGANGRVFIHYRFWNFETGHLVVSYTQEALVRQKQPRL
jgi:acyl-CoA thioesterase